MDDIEDYICVPYEWIEADLQKSMQNLLSNGILYSYLNMLPIYTEEPNWIY